MMERIDNLPAGVIGVRAKGKITRDDYDEVIGPMLEQARQQGRSYHLLYHLGSDFEAFTPLAALQDARIGLRHVRQFKRCAVVSSKGWIQKSAKLAGALMPCEVRVYPEPELTQAIDWLAEPTQARNLSHQLLADLGTLIIEPTGRLKAEDFQALAATVDPWLADHGNLRGLVIRAQQFPGWQDFWGLLGHVKFVRDHHAVVRRVAFVSDGRFAHFVQKLGDRFGQAEVAQFDYDQFEPAVKWASAESSEARAAATASETDAS